MKRSKNVLITRPWQDAQECAQEVEERGFIPVVEPMLEIVPVPFTLPPGNFQALVFTSANGVRMAAGRIDDRSHPVYGVGARTADVAREKGWADVKAADGDIGALNALLATEGLSGAAPVLHLAGADIAGPVEIPGVTVERLTVYKAQPAQKFSPNTFDLLVGQNLAAALFFSARSAAAFAALVERYGCTRMLGATKALCLADSVVKSVMHLPWQDVQVAARPDRTSLLALLGRNEDEVR